VKPYRTRPGAGRDAELDFRLTVVPVVYDSVAPGSREGIATTLSSYVSILCQDVDVSKLPLDLFDTLEAVGMCRAVARGGYRGPAGITRDDRDRN
jgi:hypothetical protein